MAPWFKSSRPASTAIPPSERSILERIAMESLREQRRARRWSVFFKGFVVAYLLFATVTFLYPSVSPSAANHTALVELNGVIADLGDIDADRVVTGLRAAFETDKAKGVILRINSPGGSPVQSRYINDEIKRLREKYSNKPVYAVVTDVCASGGYYVAVAADRIYANEASIVGSIGVLMNGFGFVEAMNKLGIERRLMTAGRHKGMLDPFSPLDAEAREHSQKILDAIHQQFIDAVKEGRGDRLADSEEVFSGLYWTGEQAKKLGLIDDFGNASYVAREIIGQEKIVDYTPEESIIERFAGSIGAAFARTLGVRALFQRLEIR